MELHREQVLVEMLIIISFSALMIMARHYIIQLQRAHIHRIRQQVFYKHLIPLVHTAFHLQITCVSIIRN